MNEAEINAISPGPYEWAVIQEGPDQYEWVKKNLDFGSGEIHMVWLPKHGLSAIGEDPTKPEHAVVFCMTGNGPKSKDNARALCCLLNQREIAKQDRQPLPIPTTPDAVAWSQYAIMLEHALGIAHPVPDSLKNFDISKHLERPSP